MSQSMTSSTYQKLFLEKIKSGRSKIGWMGMAMVLLGGAAIVFPGFFTLTLSLFVGWMFLLSGVVSFFSAFSVTGTGAFFGNLLLGVLKLVSGYLVLTEPELGAVFLTIILAVVFLMEGVHELMFAYELKGQKGRSWMFISGVISVLAGFYVWTSLPEASLWLVGFLFGISFLSTGISSLFLSRSLSKMDS